jgi:hypothetical protein
MRGQGMVLAGVIVVAACGGSTGTSSASPRSSPAKIVYLDQSDKGDRDFGPISIDKPWRVDWSYDCTGTTEKQWLIVALYRDAGNGSAPLYDTLTGAIGPSGSGVMLENKTTADGPPTGQFYIKVRSVCSWHLNAKPA